MRKSFLILGAILILATLLRLVWIGSVPNSITYDQLYYVMNAKSFLLTGKDIVGSVSPFQLFMFQYPKEALVQAELPFFLLFPFLSLFPLSYLTVVLPNIILSVLTVLVLYLIGRKLFDHPTALVIALVAAINPWSVFIGRTFYEVVPAVFFFLCGWYVLLITRKWKILWAFPFFLLAFYSYIGTKLIFFPFLLLATFYSYFFVYKKQYLKQYFVLNLLGVATVGFFYLMIQMQPELSRMGEIVTPFHPKMAEMVDAMRETSMQHPILSLFENKYTAFIRVVMYNLFNVFDPGYLFAFGDTFFSMYRHGLFYLVDSIFLLIGAVAVFLKKRALFFFMAAAILLSTLPQVVHDAEASGNFTPHIALLFPFFFIFIAVGVLTATTFLQGKFRVASAVLIGGIYLFSLANFVSVYFYHFPLETGIFDISSRIIAKHVYAAKEQHRTVYVFSPFPDDTYKKYLFYTNSYIKERAEKINMAFRTKQYEDGNVKFLKCNTPTPERNKADLFLEARECGKLKSPETVSIVQLSDSASTHEITHDKLCRDYPLKNFLSGLTPYQLTIEKLSTKEFCETYIIR